MGQGESEKIKIPSWVLRRLEKRESLVKEQNEELNRIQSEGKVSRRDSARISRRAVSIESIDRQMYRSGFIPPQTATPTSRTTQIAPSMMAFDSASGFNISPRRGGGGGGGGAPIGHPFKIALISNQWTVSAGTINSLIPVGIFEGNNLKNYPTSSSINYFILRAISDGSQITSASIILRSFSAEVQEPTIFGLPSEVEFVIGVVNNTQVYQVTYDNILISGKQSFVKTKDSPASAGELPIDVYYVWG
jgi:hypothetical protein